MSRRPRPTARCEDRGAEAPSTRRALPCAYSVATWSARARASSAGAIAASDATALPQCARRRQPSTMMMPRRASSTITCERDVHVERLQDRADVHLDRTFGQSKVAADQLVGLALRQQPHDVALPLREAQGTSAHGRRRPRAAAAAVARHVPPPASTVRSASSTPQASPVLAMKPARAGAERGADGRAVVRGRSTTIGSRGHRGATRPAGRAMRPGSAGRAAPARSPDARERGERLVAVVRRQTSIGRGALQGMCRSASCMSGSSSITSISDFALPRLAARHRDSRRILRGSRTSPNL